MDSMNGYYENGIFLGYLTLFFRGFKKISCGKFRFRLTASRNKNTKKVSSVLFFFFLVISSGNSDNNTSSPEER